MKRVILLAIASLWSIGEQSHAQQLVQLSSRRIDLDPITQEQFVDVWLYASEAVSLQSVDTSHEGGVAHDLLAIETDGAVLATQGGEVLLETDVTAQAKCNTVIGETRTIPLIEVSGNADSVSGATIPFTYSRMEDCASASSAAVFEILPKKRTRGFELGEPVTVEGWFYIDMGGTYPGDAGTEVDEFDTFDGTAYLELGDSFVAFQYWGGEIGWTIFGQLTQSSQANPNAPPLALTGTHGGNVNILYAFTEATPLTLDVPMFVAAGIETCVVQIDTGPEQMTRQFNASTWYKVWDTRLQ